MVGSKRGWSDALPLAALIGSPLGHSLFPVIHRAAFASAGRARPYVPFDVPAGLVGEALEAMRTLEIAELSVTTPQKEQVSASIDWPTPTALRSVTVAVVAEGRRRRPARRCGASSMPSAGRRRSLSLSTRAASSAAEVAPGVAPAAVDSHVALAAAELIVNAAVRFGTGGLPLDSTVLHPERLLADLALPPARYGTVLRRARRWGADVRPSQYARPPGRAAATAVDGAS